jgi:hypothetical protein
MSTNADAATIGAPLWDRLSVGLMQTLVERLP